jgi:hypothetical protein
MKVWEWRVRVSETKLYDLDLREDGTPQYVGMNVIIVFE